jgi:hypothetical protein
MQNYLQMKKRHKLAARLRIQKAMEPTGSQQESSPAHALAKQLQELENQFANRPEQTETSVSYAMHQACLFTEEFI